MKPAKDVKLAIVLKIISHFARSEFLFDGQDCLCPVFLVLFGLDLSESKTASTVSDVFFPVRAGMNFLGFS